MNRHKAHPNKATHIAEQLRNDLKLATGRDLPSLDELANTYDTSRMTMHAAVHILCKEGILSTKAGSGISVVRAKAGYAENSAGKLTEITHDLQSHITSSGIQELPSATLLAQQFGISLLEMRTVLQNLEKEGVLSLQVRRRAKVCNLTKNAAAPPHLTSEEALYKRLRERIESGVYPTAQPIPKYSYLAYTEKTSIKTIARVLRRLEREGHIYRTGRMRCAGAPLGADGLSAHQHRKCILIIQPRDTTWDAFAVEPWTMPFAQAFMREMSLYGIQPIVALQDSPAEGQVHEGIALDKDALAAVSDRLLGILVVNKGWNMHDKEATRRNLSYAEWLCNFNKPVIFFDHFSSAHERWFDQEMREMLVATLKIPQVKQYFTRCYQDYFGLAKQAIQVLYRHGHRTVGYPTPIPAQSWMTYRQKALLVESAKTDAPTRTLTNLDCPPIFNSATLKTLDDVIYALTPLKHACIAPFCAVLTRMGTACTCITALSVAQQQLIDCAAYLIPYIMHPECTALIAPSDIHARILYRFCTVAGIRIPEDYSLISFDDHLESAYPHTISSINFGLDSLGYAAFHSLLGDIPLKADSWKSITAKSRINHFATINQNTRA